MRVLCDTNILLRAVSSDSPHHTLAIRSLVKLKTSGKIPVIVPQCIYEFYVVATKKVADNGLGLNPGEALQTIEGFLAIIPLLRDERLVFAKWMDLMHSTGVKGKGAHDGRIVAAMRRHNVKSIVTFNDRDFRRYADITVLTPKKLIDEN